MSLRTHLRRTCAAALGLALGLSISATAHAGIEIANAHLRLGYERIELPGQETMGLLGIVAIPWLNDPLWAKISILFVNLWLGFPYMMTATMSALSTINDDLYEAASIDGASRWQQITGITLPLLQKSFTPILLSTFAFNFNNFGIIYLLTAGGPAQEGRESTAQSTDILLSWGYNTAFAASGGQNYALASAIALIIFFLTLAISLVNFKAAGVFDEART